MISDDFRKLCHESGVTILNEFVQGKLEKEALTIVFASGVSSERIAEFIMLLSDLYGESLDVVSVYDVDEWQHVNILPKSIMAQRGRQD